MKLNSSLIQLVKKGQFSLYTSSIEKISFFLFFVIAARVSSVNDYGYLVAVFALSNILSYLLEFGFGPYLQRESSADSSTLNREYSQIIILKSTLFIPYLIFCQLYFLLTGSSNPYVILLVSTLIYILNFNSTLNYILYGRSKYRESFYAHTTGKIVFICFAFLSLLIIKNYYFLIGIMLLGGIIQLIMIINYLKKEGFVLSWGNLEISILKNIFVTSLPIGMGIFFVFIYDKIDILIIQNILNLKSVAIYSVGYSLYKLPVILISVILVPIYTDLSSHFRSTRELNIHTVKTAGYYLLVYACITIMIFYFCADYFILLLFGDKYNNSIVVAKILTLGLPGLFLNNLTGVVLNSIRKEKYPLYAAILGMTINILMNFILIPIIGIYGAVWATIVSETFVFLFQIYFLLKFIKFINLHQTD